MHLSLPAIHLPPKLTALFERAGAIRPAAWGQPPKPRQDYVGEALSKTARTLAREMGLNR